MSANNPLELLQAHKVLEESIIREIVRRLLKTDFQITETTGYQITKAQEAGVLYETIVKEASASSKKTVEEIKEAFGAAGLSEVGFSYEGELSKRADAEKVKEYSPVMRQLYAAALNKACTSAVNFTKTTASTTQTTFINACDLAHNQIISGVFSYEAALANAIKSAADTGATTIHYESGVSRQLDSALRSAVMTGINQTVGEKALMDADILGTDIMEITVTSAARPEHARWQGRLVSLSGRKGYLSLSDVGYGSVTGIFGANCGHNWGPFIEGISKRIYTDEELERLSNETVTYNGVTMPKWQAVDKQRSAERVIKKQKRELVAYDEALKNHDSTELRSKFNKTAEKLKRNEKKLQDFCNQTGLKRDRFREQVFAAKTENNIKNWGKSVSQKTVWANKRALTQQLNNGKINILPGVENVEIKREKFTEYALNPLKEPNKAKAFKEALGYTLDNADELIENIYSNIANYNAVEKSDNGYGVRYEILMTLTGANGKKANVKTAWIVDKKTGKTRLTSAYVTKKKIKEQDNGN